MAAPTLDSNFQPAVAEWFRSIFTDATASQMRGWPVPDAKQRCRVVTRDERHAANFAGFVHLACMIILLRALTRSLLICGWY